VIDSVLRSYCWIVPIEQRIIKFKTGMQSLAVKTLKMFPYWDLTKISFILQTKKALFST